MRKPTKRHTSVRIPLITDERKSFKPSRPILFILQHLKAIRRSFRHLSVSLLTSLMTFAVVGIVLALPMGLFVFLKNIQTVTSGLQESVQISVYLQKNTPNSQLNDLMRILKLDRNIQNIKYISPNEGLKEFKKYSGFGDALKALKTNPLPGVIVITPAVNVRTNLQIQQLLARIQKQPYVDKAQLDMKWLKRLNAIIAVAHRLTFAITLIFFLAVLLIINHTIRLMTQNYRSEIEILKLFGATDSFIRRPFLYSGIIVGLVGGIIAWFLVDGIMWFLQSPVTDLANLYGTNFETLGLNLHATLILLGSGILLGYIGSWLAVARHIRDIDHHLHQVLLSP